MFLDRVEFIALILAFLAMSGAIVSMFINLSGKGKNRLWLELAVGVPSIFAFVAVVFTSIDISVRNADITRIIPHGSGVPPEFDKLPLDLKRVYFSARDAMREMNVDLKYPSRMKFNRASLVELRVPLRNLSDAGKITAEKVYTETNIKARLTPKVRIILNSYDNDVDIRALSPEVRDITPYGDAVWRWAVTPKRPGAFPLEFNVFNQWSARGQTIEIDGPTIVKEVQAEANPFDWFLFLVGRYGAQVSLAIGISATFIGMILFMLRKIEAGRKSSRGADVP